MNWLAHIFISENPIDYQLGNLLADPLKGKVWKGCSEKFAQGINMHACIDSFTDRHPCVIRSKSRLGAHGYLRGAVVDIAYDYLLLKNWDRFAKQNSDDFIDDFHAKASIAIDDYPEQASCFVRRLVQHQVLSSYESLSGVKTALQRLDKRLSDRVLVKESCHGYFTRLSAAIDKMDNDFLLFFPDLLNYFKSISDFTNKGSWIK